MKSSMLMTTVLAGALMACAETFTYKVAPGECDLTKIRDAVRTLRATGGAAHGKDVVVEFAPGNYNITNSVTLTKEDGGSAEQPIVWRAAEAGTVHLKGGITLSFKDFNLEELNGRKVLCADLSKRLPKLEPWPNQFNVPPMPWLYQNERPLEIARWPNGNEWTSFTNAPSDGLQGRPGIITYTNERVKKWDFANGVWMHGFWRNDWSENFIRAANYNAASNTITMAGKHGYGFGGKTYGLNHRRFYTLNALSELDERGEWHLDREHRILRLIPLHGAADAKFTLATLTNAFVTLNGCNNIKFENLIFEFAHAPQGAMNIANAQGVTIAHCQFSNLGYKALNVSGRDILISHSQFYNLGTSGISLVGGDRASLTRSNIIVDGCDIHHFGRFQMCYCPGVSMYGCGHTVRNSSFHDAPHSAILYYGNDHHILSNEFSRVLLQTHDAGAIYEGRNASELGELIEGNYFHDLGNPKERSMTSGVYFDDCDWGGDVIGNTFENVGMPILLGGGNCHNIISNYVRNALMPIHIDSRGSTWKYYTSNTNWWRDWFKPFSNNTWRTKYADAFATLDDTPNLPWRTSLVGNMWVDCKRNNQFDKNVNSVTNRMNISGNTFVRTPTNSLPLANPLPTPKFALGYMLDISRDKVPTQETLYRIVDILAALGYNQFQLYSEHTFRYAKHETVWRDWSPISPEEIRALDAYCAARNIELVPNQNSFGHMEKWLVHDAYKPMAEAPNAGIKTHWNTVTKVPMALCPTDERSLPFIASLYDELLPNFNSKLFNVGCDEVVDMDDGTSRSKDAVKAHGLVHVYLDFLKKIHAEVTKRGRTMMFWGDIILHHPELISELPENIICLNWGYESNHPFEKECAAFERAGRKFYVCPGTSGWLSISGRWKNARGNIDAAVTSGIRHGACGLLLTDWGDGGHGDPWAVALPALVYAAARVHGEFPTDAEIAERIDKLVGGKAGASLLRYGDIYLKSGVNLFNCTAPHYYLRNGERKGNMTDAGLEAVITEWRAAQASVNTNGAPQWVADAFTVMDLMYSAVEMRFRNRWPEVQTAIVPRYRELWLKYNRPGGLDNASVPTLFKK